MPQFLGQKVRYVRQQLGLTQVEMAHYLGISSYTHLTKIEASQRFPSLSLIVRIARLSSTTTDYFLRDSTPIAEVVPVLFAGRIGAPEEPLFLGEKLRDMRTRFGWGQTELARRLHLARRGYISNLETGKKEPSLELIVQIADLFEVTTNYLLRDELPLQDQSPHAG